MPCPFLCPGVWNEVTFRLARDNKTSMRGVRSWLFIGVEERLFEEEDRFGLRDDLVFAIQVGAQVLRDAEESLVGLAIIKFQLRAQFAETFVDGLRAQFARIGFLRRQKERPGHVKGRYKRVKRPHDFEQLLQRIMQHAVKMDLQQAPRTGLRDEQTIRRQPLDHLAVKLQRVKLVRWPAFDRRRQIGNDDVELLRGLQNKFARVIDDQPRLRVGQSAQVPILKELFAEIHDFAINVHHRHLLDARVAQNLADGGPFAAAQDQHLLRLRMQHHRWLHEAFMVNKFIQLGGLHFAIEDQTTPERIGIRQDRLLEFSLLFNERLFDVMAVGFVGRKTFGKPAVGQLV